jgi:hypothetical protein
MTSPTEPPTEPHPSFVIIGAQKSATRWLRRNMGAHPGVFTAPTELEFFLDDERYARGRSWYVAQFEGWQGEPIVGESTPGYMMLRHRPRRVARRIKRFDGDMRLIAILRNPVDRAYSAFVHHMRRGRVDPEAELLVYVRSIAPRRDPLSIVAGGYYAASLRPFRRAFGDKLLVLLHDDVGTDPLAVCNTALAHVGASPGFVPAGLERVRFSNTGYTPLTPEQRNELYAYFRDDVRELEHMIDRDLSLWAPD